MSEEPTKREVDEALAEMERLPPVPSKCLACGADIRVGYSWKGLCVVCADPRLAREEEA